MKVSESLSSSVNLTYFLASGKFCRGTTETRSDRVSQLDQKFTHRHTLRFPYKPKSVLNMVDVSKEPPTNINPYEVLQLEITASSSDVKSAYKKLALKHHPGEAGI